MQKMAGGANIKAATITDKSVRIKAELINVDNEKV